MGVISNGVMGIYTVTLKDSAGNTKFESTFENLILDTGLVAMANAGLGATYAAYTDWYNLFKTAYLGTGTAVPQPTDTGLTGISAASSNSTVIEAAIVTSPQRYKKGVVQMAFNPGIATGTWSEVGIMGQWSSSGTAWMSKTLIKDAQGNPTTVTKAATDYLYIKYEFRQYIPMDDFAGTMVLDGITYNYTVRPIGVETTNSGSNYWTCWGNKDQLTNAHGMGIGSYVKPILYDKAVLVDPTAVQAVNGGSSQYALNPCTTTYTPGAPYRDVNVVLDPTSGNFNDGIKLMTLTYTTNLGTPYEPSGYQIAFDPPLPKNSNNAINLTFRWEFSRM